MAPKDSSDCVVTVTIELGHHANFLKEPSPEGFTHDWTVFVRGYEGSQLKYFVEKVVFKLHKTFKSPVRVISEPPFEVTESGYAGFILPIEIHFKNKQTPRKIVFSYDLFLNAKDSPPINNVRYEKLKFQNPTPEFKAKLIKAGGTEQGAEHVPYDLFGSPVRSEKKVIPKIPRDKDKDKILSGMDKIKKKKSSPHAKSTSPAQSLSSLSSMSSDEDDDGGGSYAALLPPPPLKKEKEPFVKKGNSSSSQPKLDSFSSSSSSQPKLDSFSSSSSHKDKSKHRSSSSNYSHKERSSSDKDAAHKPHKHKEKDKERDKTSSHKSKEGEKKERDSNSQKIGKDNLETRKESEGSHSSGKSSTSFSQLDNKIGVQMFVKVKEKISQSKGKEISSSSKEKSNLSSKEREKISSKEKHSTHKDVSPPLNAEIKKIKEDTSKTSKEKDRHSKKSHKRHLESSVQEDDSEKKQLKRSSSVASIDDKSVKSKSSSGKEKSTSKESKEKESIKDVKDKAAKPSSSSRKSKDEKSRHSEKHRHSHASGSKQESSAKHSETPQKLEKVSKSETMTQSERLAMTADYQPQLLLSPLKSKSDEEESPAHSPLPVEKTKLKPAITNSSPDSQSSIMSSDDASKSDHEMLEPQVNGNKLIVSGLTDSDSDSEDEVPYVRSPQKELKSILNKQAPQVNKNSSQKHVRRSSQEEKSKKMDCEPTENSAKKVDTNNKYNKEEKRANTAEENKSSKAKYIESKMECSDDEVNVEDVSVTNNSNDQDCNGLDILAPNGISIGELIAINEKIEKAQADPNQELLDRVIQIIGETDDFDISDVSLSFDICSVDKNVVLQIQAVLREY